MCFGVCLAAAAEQLAVSQSVASRLAATNISEGIFNKPLLIFLFNFLIKLLILYKISVLLVLKCCCAIIIMKNSFEPVLKVIFNVNKLYNCFSLLEILLNTLSFCYDSLKLLKSIKIIEILI